MFNFCNVVSTLLDSKDYIYIYIYRYTIFLPTVTKVLKIILFLHPKIMLFSEASIINV